MKKGVIKAGVLTIVFLLALVVFSILTNHTNEDLTTEMDNATLPIVHLYTGETEINELHGYTTAMDVSYMRDTITPVGSDMVLPANIRTYGKTIDSITYKIRSLDGVDLIANAEITDLTESAGSIQVDIPIQNLIKEGQEYNLIIELNSGKNTIYYYTRIVQDDNNSVDECISFVSNFHNTTFAEDSSSLATYMEPDASADNSSLHKVSINSTLKQVTWADFEGTELTAPIASVKEISSTYDVITLDYVVTSTGDNGEMEYYNVEEYYRVRYTSARIYLLNFERTMNQIFRGENDSFYDKYIQLGIRSEDVDYKSNESGSIVCFVQEGELWSYDEANSRLSQVFSFRGFEGIDDRENYNQHDIKIISIDESGSINFAVYGYMNRGDHEGEVGIGVYHFDSVANTVEEEVFISSTQSYQVMKSTIGQLIYENEEGQLYIMMEGTVYEIDLNTRKTSTVVSGLQEESYAISKSDQYLAYIDGDSTTGTEVHILDLGSGEDNTISAGSGEYIRPLGFMDDDLIYGVAKQENVATDAAGNTLFPMYKVSIANITDGSNSILKEYQKDGYYISGISISDYTIYLERLTFNGMAYVQTDKDTIMNREGDTEKVVELHETNTDVKETQIQLALADEIADTSPKLLTPKQILLEENRDVTIELPNLGEKYYVYSQGGVSYASYNLKEAINQANDNMGVVIGDGERYIWKRARKNTCSALNVTIGDSDSNSSSIAKCISALLETKEINLSVQELLDSGDTPKGVLNDSMQDCMVLDLSGCDVEEVLYYVSNGVPVFAMVSNTDAVLVTGYDANDVIIYDPSTGSNTSKTFEEARTLFSQAGNTFFTYIN